MLKKAMGIMFEIGRSVFNHFNNPTDISKLGEVISSSPSVEIVSKIDKLPELPGLKSMDISLNGLCELASDEGLMLTPYLDEAGIKTVGIGSTMSDIPDLPSWSWDKEIAIPDAVSIYKKSLKKYIDAVNKALKVEVSQNEFDALVSFTYNVGVGALKSATFMKLINTKSDPKKIVSAMKLYNKVKINGKLTVSKGLINRRAKETDVYLNNNYQSKGSVDLIMVNDKHQPLYKTSKKIGLINYLK